MILREIQQYRVLDATTTSLANRPLDYRPILAPLLDWRVEIVEQRLVLVEPQSGSLGNPDPNAFMVVVPTSFAVGSLFAIELLGTDWESEGFAIGDELAMAMGPINPNSIFLQATIQGISGTIATFRISSTPQIFGSLDTQNPFPLVAFLLNERFDIRTALLRAGDSGFVSPLNGQPFYVPGHANHIEVTTYSIANSSAHYNLRFYNASQEGDISVNLPGARNLKVVTIGIRGTQFYTYRSSLNPTANTPTQAYPTRGQIVLDAQAPNELRSLTFETECLLLHPNRIEETNNFVAPGSLIINSLGAIISHPSITSPVRTAVCLLGPDSHHSLPSLFSSVDLTNPTAPPSYPQPRQGADYVGVVTGQVGGQWVAIMTNRVPSGPPNYNLRIINEELRPARYDCVVLETEEASARLSGIYTVIIYGLKDWSFIPLASYEMEISLPRGVISPKPDFGNALEVIGNLFPFERAMPAPYGVRVANYDSVFTNGHPVLGTKSLFFVPIPSAAEPPPIGTLIPPNSAYLLDLLGFIDYPFVLKAQLICPDGTLLESEPVFMPDPRPDRQLASVTHVGDTIRVVLNLGGSDREPKDIQIRIALFPWPARYTPIDQAMYFAREKHAPPSVLEHREHQGSRIQITRTPLTGYSYVAEINTLGLPPGQYAVHVRSEYAPPENGIYYESFFYLFTVRNPIEPDGTPLPPIRCRTETPAILGESWPYIVLRGDEIEKRDEVLNSCKLDDYCSCFTFVSAIPEDWVDIIGFFKGSVLGRPIPSGGPTAQHKVRLQGRIVRIDDEYSTESFVSSVYREEDIVRSYAPRYQLEVIAQTPCDLSHIDLLKLAAHWTVVNRSNRMLPQELYFLRPAEISLSDSGEHTKATITLKPLRWRDEYRRQG
jgi:hypothetical protein